MTPYSSQNKNWVTVTEQNKLRITGGNSLFSKFEPHILASRATSFNYTVETEAAFNPDHYSETAGLGLYYDSNNWLYLTINYEEESHQSYLTIVQAKLGERITYDQHRVPVVFADPTNLKIKYNNGFATLMYKFNDSEWQVLQADIDVKYLSDEGVNGAPGEIGGFTGLFNFIGAVDAHQHNSFADFNYYHVINE